jgi:membrane protein DedA with SNARE-associated domain
MPTLPQIVAWLIIYKYWVIFPIAVFEGPIITIIAGFLASTGVLNFWLALTVVALGDLVADNLYYALGRYGREKFIHRFGKYLGLNEQRIIQLEKHFENHPWKTFTFGKFVHGTGSPILVAGGLAKVPYLKFIGYNIPTTVLNSSILIVIGYYFGHAYQRFNTYLGYYAIFGALILVILYIYLIKKSKKSLDE